MGNTPLIGRTKEQQILQQVLNSPSAEMVAVIGRRRVGKTFLIHSTFQHNIVFSFTGLHNGSLEEQLQNFSYQLKEYMGASLPIKAPDNWLEAFHLLITFLKEKQSQQEKLVVFLDELPWIATPKSGFLRALGYFWNSWAVRENIVVVISGSAASWMVQKVVNDKGSLHHRITKRIFLEPFDLVETAAFLKSLNVHFNDYQIAQLYMAIGGVPYYLKEIKAGKSAQQNIETICFSKNGLLKDEFSRLYNSLFTNAQNHIAVVRALATEQYGLLRGEIATRSGMSNGGGLTKVLDELSHAGFIHAYYPFTKNGKTKSGKRYRLIDEYSLFYLSFIENNTHNGTGIWQHLQQTTVYQNWRHYIFTNLCLKHISAIKKTLGITGVYSVPYTFHKSVTPNNKNLAIDLLLVRDDKIINLFEFKFCDDELSLTKADVTALRRKASIFRATTQTKSRLSWIFVSPFALKQNQHSLEIVEHSISLEDLFVK